MFSKMNKTEIFTPGLVCVLHSFGRDLKWNPHIHALISEGGAGNIPEKHFKMLRYYGIYAKHHKQEKNLRKCLSYKKRPHTLM